MSSSFTVPLPSADAVMPNSVRQSPFASLLCKLFCCMMQKKAQNVAATVFCPELRLACCIMDMAQAEAKKRKLRAPIDRRRVSPGDVFHVPKTTCCRNHDAMYALTDERLLHLQPDPPKFEWATFQSVSKSMYGGSESRKIEPFLELKPLDKLKGVTLASRMVGRHYPYRSARCNAKHYVDYLTYGKTFGELWMPNYLPASQSCPVFAPLDFSTDTNSPDFKLMDNKGTLYELNPPLLRPPQMQFSLRGAAENFGSKVLERGRSTASNCFACCGGGMDEPQPRTPSRGK